MQTSFSKTQLADPDIREADRILRKCVHCGFCNATCPTFRILGDELDGPRGRIYLIKDLLENQLEPGPAVVRHLDRCLSCLSCMSTCPSGVDYQHLVDHGRSYIERHHRRPLAERLLRGLLLRILPRPALLAWLLPVRGIGGLLRPLLGRRLRAAWNLGRAMPRHRPAGVLAPAHSSECASKGTVALLPGCVQQLAGQEINLATIRLLNRLGYAVRVLHEVACCGAVEQHLGGSEQAVARARGNVRAWARVRERDGPLALVVNASGCGTMLKDYGHLLRTDQELAAGAAALSAQTLDLTEFLSGRDLDGLRLRAAARRTVAYQNPCSMRHGQRILRQPADLLARFGYDVREAPDDHLCCGSAGTYNLLQPELAAELGRRKSDSIRALEPQLVASGNLGCMLQLRQYLTLPVVHTAQLLDWASGGPMPADLLAADDARG